MATISMHPYGLYEEETYAGDRQIFYTHQEPSIYQQPAPQCQQQYQYPSYPIIQDQPSWPIDDTQMDLDISNCWLDAPQKLPLDQQQFYSFNQYIPEYFDPAQFEYPPLSPITPAASPYQQDQYLAIPSSFQFNTFQNQFPLPTEETPQSSPYSSVPSLTTSPVQYEAADEEEEEEEEEEDDISVIPNCGNKELRGMGLYDDRPDLTFVPCSAPSSPMKGSMPLLGRGLVLERGFGLPEKMMIKDEETGDIVEGRLCVDEEDY